MQNPANEYEKPCKPDQKDQHNKLSFFSAQSSDAYPIVFVIGGMAGAHFCPTARTRLDLIAFFSGLAQACSTTRTFTHVLGHVSYPLRMRSVGGPRKYPFYTSKRANLCIGMRVPCQAGKYLPSPELLRPLTRDLVTFAASGLAVGSGRCTSAHRRPPPQACLPRLPGPPAPPLPAPGQSPGLRT